jgi:hypothetical protein
MSWAGLEDEQPENSYATPQAQPAQQAPADRSEMQNGTYQGRATGDVTWGTSSNQNLQICVLCRIVNGPFDGTYVSWIGTFAEGKATDMAINALRAFGWKGMDPTRDLSGLTDNEVDLVIEMEQSQNNGNWYPKVKFVNRPGSGAMMRFKQPVEGPELMQWGPFIVQAAKALWLEQHPNEPMPGEARLQQRSQVSAQQRTQPRMAPPERPMGQPQGPVSAGLQRQQYQQPPQRQPQQQQLPPGGYNAPMPPQRQPMRPAPQQRQTPQQQPQCQPDPDPQNGADDDFPF